MINRLISMLPALLCALLVQAVQAQSPSEPQSKPQSSQPQSKPQSSAAQSKPLSSPPVKAEAQGGFLYKSTMPDGKVIYGDAPMPGAVKVDKTRPDTSQKGITAATPKEKEALRRMEAERAGSGTGKPQQQGPTTNYTEAQMDAKLRELEVEREKGKEPLPGERIGTATGGSRFTDAYWDRQRRLDQGLDSIRKDVERARSGAK